MNKYYYLTKIFIVLILCNHSFGQPNIRIEPRNIKFEDVFSRFDYTYIYNDGNQVLFIDSLSSANSYYILDFENHQQLPIALNPG
ncbi:MAG: hypothetical protein ACK4UV_06135, partial [Ignavibacterium sp.]